MPRGRLVDDQDFDNPDNYEAAVLTHSSLQHRDHSVLATMRDESSVGQDQGRQSMIAPHRMHQTEQ